MVVGYCGEMLVKPARNYFRSRSRAVSLFVYRMDLSHSRQKKSFHLYILHVKVRIWIKVSELRFYRNIEYIDKTHTTNTISEYERDMKGYTLVNK